MEGNKERGKEDVVKQWEREETHKRKMRALASELLDYSKNKGLTLEEIEDVSKEFEKQVSRSVQSQKREIAFKNL